MVGILLPTSTPSQNPLADKITLWKAAVDKNRQSTLLLPPHHDHCSMARWRARVHNWLHKTVQTRHTQFIWRREPLLGSLPDHFHHILHDCPRYTAARLSAGGHWQWDDEFKLYYFQLHSSWQFLDFLQMSQAAFLPPQWTVAPFELWWLPWFVMIGLHHLRRHVGLLRFFSWSNPHTVAHVRYNLTTSW